MNRLFVFCIAALTATTGIADEREVDKRKNLVSLTSEVYKIDEDAPTVGELASTARRCMLSKLTNSEVVTRGSTQFLGAGGPKAQSVVGGGELIQVFDEAEGLVVANQSRDYRWLALNQNVRSRMTLEAREGRFRIVHSAIESVSRSTGSTTNRGYAKVSTRRGAGGKPAIRELETATELVAQCVLGTSAETDDDW